MKPEPAGKTAVRAMFLVTSALTAMGALSGCVVAGYSSRGGFFLWPGSFVLFIIVIVLVLLLRRR